MMEFTFTCTHVADTFFNDLGISVRSGKKFDFFEEGKLSGTLIDYDLGAIGNFRGGTVYTAKNNSFWKNSFSFRLEDDAGNLFAKGDVENRIKESLLIFPTPYTSYNLSMDTNHHTASGYRDKAEFYIGNDVYCIINYFPFVQADNWLKRNFSNSPFEGTIALADGLSREHLLGFLLLLHRQIALKRD